MIEWPSVLIDSLARKRAVLFLGSGVSKNSQGLAGKRPSTWAEFLFSALDECDTPKRHIQTLLNNNDYLTACEIIKEKLDEKWFSLLKTEFVDPRYTPARIHNLIFNIGANLVLTPNFDKVYDNYAQSESRGTIATKTYYDDDLVDVVRGAVPAILKIHGTIDTPNKMIFTREDYTQAKSKHTNFYHFLDALALTHTFLFIGCGLNDPDMQIFLEKARGTHPNQWTPHYMTFAKPVHNDLIQSLRKNLNLKVLPYSKKDEHKELTDSLEVLVEKVETCRAALAEAQSW